MKLDFSGDKNLGEGINLRKFKDFKKFKAVWVLRVKRFCDNYRCQVSRRDVFAKIFISEVAQVWSLNENKGLKLLQFNKIFHSCTSHMYSPQASENDLSTSLSQFFLKVT